MVDDQDWEAICDSEIFRSYVNNEMRRESQEAAFKKANMFKEIEQKLDEELAIDASLEAFQKKVDSTPKLKECFKKCLAALEADPSLKNKVDSRFISGLELLDLSG
jgi:hypothetical protein